MKILVIILFFCFLQGCATLAYYRPVSRIVEEEKFLKKFENYYSDLEGIKCRSDMQTSFYLYGIDLYFFMIPMFPLGQPFNTSLMTICYPIYKEGKLPDIFVNYKDLKVFARIGNELKYKPVEVSRSNPDLKRHKDLRFYINSYFEDKIEFYMSFKGKRKNYLYHLEEGVWEYHSMFK